MYEQFYGLTDKPFSLTPNPRFVFYSQQYREAESQLLYGINNREGFMLVTGQPGTGKTTLCRDLIEKLDRDKTQSALIFNPFLNGVEMLAALLNEFGVSVPPNGTRKELLDRLNQFLLAQLALGKSCVAIFDEAQHLSPEFLEQIRVLSNLETDQEKLIQIILAGQPELLDKIRTPKMAQLDQRVSIRCTLNDLEEQETDHYIHHRLNVAGARGQIRFTPKAVNAIFRASHGVPRLINLICDRALLAGYAAQTRDIGPEHVRKAVAALRGEDADVEANVSAVPQRSLNWKPAVAAAVAAAVIAGGAYLYWPKPAQRATDEALYWNATTATSPADAERDLRTLVATYPRSRRYDDALLRLASLELARGDRPSAIQHFHLLAQHVPAGPAHTRAIVLASVAQLDGGDTTNACRALPAGLDSTSGGDVLLSQQIQTVSTACASHITTAAGSIDSAAHTSPSPTSTTSAPTRDSSQPVKRATLNDTSRRRRARATIPVTQPPVQPAIQVPIVTPPTSTNPGTPPPNSPTSPAATSTGTSTNLVSPAAPTSRASNPPTQQP
jgi:type II secretory pathway predicted ATPase ExeA